MAFFHHISFCTFLLAILLLVAVTEQRKLKVLVLSAMPAWSHMQYMGKIADTLAEAGHEVHYLKLSSDPELAAKNETKLARRIHRITPTFSSQEDLDLNRISMVNDPFKSTFPRLTMFDHMFDEAFPMFKAICTELTANEALLEELSREHFDVAIAEMFEMCSFAMFERIQVKTKLAALAVPPVQFSVFRLGVPTFSSFVPNVFAVPLSAPNLTFMDRVLNFYNDLYDWARTNTRMDQITQEIVRQNFGADFPSNDQLAKSISLLFVNANPFLAFARPLTNKVVHIGGLVNAHSGKLDARTQSILEGAKRGAVLVSFGSITDTSKMSAQMVAGFVHAFARFPDYAFIWKLDAGHRLNNSALFASVPNVHTFDWVQQSAILRHPKLRGFISHCGQNSLTEAARTGVPLVAVPLFADQLYNAQLAKTKGMAVHIDVRQLQTPEAEQLLADSLEKILHTPSYRSNAQLVQKKLALTPFSAHDQLIRWVEFAAEFPHLNELNLPTDADMHWTAYYSVDVIAFSTAGVALLAITATLMLAKLLRFVAATAKKGAQQKPKQQ